MRADYNREILEISFSLSVSIRSTAEENANRRCTLCNDFTRPNCIPLLHFSEWRARLNFQALSDNFSSNFFTIDSSRSNVSSLPVFFLRDSRLISSIISISTVEITLVRENNYRNHETQKLFGIMYIMYSCCTIFTNWTRCESRAFCWGDVKRRNECLYLLQNTNLDSPWQHCGNHFQKDYLNPTNLPCQGRAKRLQSSHITRQDYI